jgi:surfeit locus 1 family protein
VLRLRQALTILVGLVLAGVMVLLGLWQLDVYQAQGQAQASRRASQPPVELSAVAQAGAAIADGYGRAVTMTGTYLPDVQVLVPLAAQPGSYRVVSALRLADGDVVPVVRGVVAGEAAPTPPRGNEAENGLLLPSEEAPAGDLPAGQLSSVRIPTLAQQWPGPLVSGFVTLTAADATAQGLAPAPVELPQASGRLRNGAYALQWWVFAAFAVALAIRMARDQELAPDEVGDLTAEEPIEAT